MPRRRHLAGRSAARHDGALDMPEFHYRALTQTGEIVTGSLSAPSQAEVARRIEYLGLIPIEGATNEKRKTTKSLGFSFAATPTQEDVTILTTDLALLLKTGARINDALELLAGDADVGRLRNVVAKVNADVLSGDSFADSLARHPTVFSQMYVALVRAGEASGSLDSILETLAAERVRNEMLRRRLRDAVRYPAFVMLASSAVLLFFLLVVLPQFETVLRDFNAKTDPLLNMFLGLSAALRAHGDIVSIAAAALLAGGWYASKQPAMRAAGMDVVSRLPFVERVLDGHKTSMFCRNLGLLLRSGIGLAPGLRILVDIMAATGKSDAWARTVDFVRQGGKLSDALAETKALPPMAVRTLRLGEETGRLPVVLGRIADFYEAKLQRNLDQIVGIIGPVAIIAISVVVGGLIVSVMTALLSVNQLVG